eukprot:TRINITY_DN1778_c0_g1_i1.p1 TRINITY_DN1778_c0_g1~~TRINITY_DN1778_c0_g1_i1.p1  ORF type:complete len:146 (+),score=50.94 TRINITY_DN1778_c0_g1_i1:186-623(+)
MKLPSFLNGYLQQTASKALVEKLASSAAFQRFAVKTDEALRKGEEMMKEKFGESFKIPFIDNNNNNNNNNKNPSAASYFKNTSSSSYNYRTSTTGNNYDNKKKPIQEEEQQYEEEGLTTDKIKVFSSTFVSAFTKNIKDEWKKIK